MHVERNDGSCGSSSLTDSAVCTLPARLNHDVSDRPQDGITERPSRHRLRDRIGRAIANGEQPPGVYFEPLMQAGLGPVDFLRQLPQIQHPAVAPPPMPGTWIGAITKMVDRWEHLHTWREQEMRLIRTAARRLQQQREQWARGLHPDVRKVIGHLHLPLLDWMVKRSSFQGTHYVNRLMQGKPCLGEITPSGVFRPERNEATLTLAVWRQAPRSRNERMLGRVCSSGAHDLDIKSWDKTLKEI